MLTLKKTNSLAGAIAPTFAAASNHLLTEGKKRFPASICQLVAWKHGMRLRRFLRNIGNPPEADGGVEERS